jgi:hypothetical protein
VLLPIRFLSIPFPRTPSTTIARVPIALGRRVSSHAPRRPASRLAGFAVIALFAALAAPSEIVRAQAPERPNAAVVDIDFPGGTLSEYLEHVNSRVEAVEIASFNVVVARPSVAARIEIPSIRLRGVSVASALQLLQLVTDRSETRISIGNVSDSVFVVQTEEARKKPGTSDAESPVRVEVVPLGQFIGRDSKLEQVEPLLSAIEQGVLLSTGSEKSGPEVRLHFETRLLFVRGTGEQIDFVKTIIENLDENRANDSAHARCAEAEKRVLDLEAALEKERLRCVELERGGEVRLRALDDERAALHKRLAEEEERTRAALRAMESSRSEAADLARRVGEFERLLGKKSAPGQPKSSN